MIELPPRTLENAFVRLEPLEEHHRDGLRAAAADPRIWIYFLTSAEGERFDPAFDAMIARNAAGIALHFAVVSPSGDVVGSTSYYMIDAPHRTVEIGATWYRASVQGTAINPACKILLLEYAFASGANRVEFKTDARNTRSRAAIEKLGAKLDGVHRRRHVMADGFVRDSAYYSLLADEWPAARALLEARLAKFAA